MKPFSTPTSLTAFQRHLKITSVFLLGLQALIAVHITIQESKQATP